MNNPILIALLLWALWFAGWMCWTRSAPPQKREGWRGRWKHWLLLVCGFGCIFSNVVTPAWYQFNWNTATYIAGLVYIIVGLTITCIARYHLGRYWTHLVGVMDDHQLIQSGPYALVRHPLYTGLLLAFMGSTAVAATPLALFGLGLVTAAMVTKLRHEEKMLAVEFPVKYAILCLDVPFRLWPLVW